MRFDSQVICAKPSHYLWPHQNGVGELRCSRLGTNRREVEVFKGHITFCVLTDASRHVHLKRVIDKETEASQPFFDEIFVEVAAGFI